MKTQKTINKVAINLMKDLIDRIPVKESGTYNQIQDATAYSKGNETFEIDGRIYKVRFNDCTWSVEVSISIQKTLILDWDNKDIAEQNLAKWHAFHASHKIKNVKYTVTGITFEVEIANFDLVGNGSKFDPYEVIIHFKQRGIYHLIHQIVKKYDAIVYEECEMEEDPMGCLADYI
jgi:RecG-like helicase